MSNPAPLKQTPLNALHRELGAKMVDFGGWDMPVNYGSQIEEHHAVRRDCGLFDVSHMLPVDVCGAGVRDFLRDMIVLKAPVTRPWIEAACAQIGCSLSLPKDAALIQIIGSDLQAEPVGAGHLQLKITLGNRAAHAQAWPVLVLTLTDRTDQAQARRSFAPSEYLSDPTLLASGIPAQSEHQLSLPLEVRNLTLAGYRLAISY